MKKQLLAVLLTSVLVCCASSWFAYRRGLQEGFVAGSAPMLGVRFHRALANLEYTRTNQTQPLIDNLETDCYSSYVHLAQFSYQQGRPVGDGTRKLIAYRARYAKPLEQQSPLEQAVTETIQKRQKGESTEMEDSPSEIASLYHSMTHS